jgi:WG containing repeat
MNKILFTLFVLFYSLSQLHAQGVVDTTLPELIPYRKGSLWGYCDKNRNLIIPIQFLHARPFIKDFAEVRTDSFTTAIIDKEGKVITRVGRDTTVWTSASGVIYVEFDDRNIISKLREQSGEWIYSRKNIIDERFSEGNYIAKKGNRIGLIDKNENTILPFKFRDISPPDERGFVRVVKKNGRTIFLDSSTKITLLKIPKKYEVGSFHNDLASVSLAKKKGSLSGFVNRTGKIVIPLVYKKTSIFINGLCEVSNGIKTGFINTKGDTVIFFKYGSPINLQNGFINYREPLQSTLYNLAGKEFFRYKVYDIDYVNDSLIVISKYGPGQMASLKWGIIDITGKEVWPCKFHSIYTNLYPGLIYVLESWNKEPYYMDYKLNKYYQE